MLRRKKLRPVEGQCLVQSHKSEPGSSTFKLPVAFLKILTEYLLKAPMGECGVGGGKSGGIGEAFQMLSLPTVLPGDGTAFLGIRLWTM